VLSTVERTGIDAFNERVERGRALIKSAEQSTALAEKESYAWSPEFRDDLSCVFCGRTERTVLTTSRPGAHLGLCEACCVNAAWAWRELPGDAPALPAKVSRPTRIKVLLPRLQKPTGGAVPSPDVSVSYEFALVKVPPALAPEPASKPTQTAGPPAQESTVLPDRDDVTRVSQIHDLPGAKLGENEDEVAAVERALGSVGIGTWPMFCEPLCSGYTPRGHFCRIYLVTAWYRRSSELPSPPQEVLVWRPGPVHESTPEMAGLYLALREVWPLRVWKHAARSTKLSAVSVQLSRGAVEYVRMQAAVRAADREVDTSMAEVLYKRMTADEKEVDKMIRAQAATRAELTSQLEAERRTVAAAAQLESDAAAGAGDLPDDEGEPQDDLSGDVTGPPSMTRVNGQPKLPSEDPDDD
jgi:hypothetical protein